MYKRVFVPNPFVEINVIEHACTGGWYIRLEHYGLNVMPNKPYNMECAVEGDREYDNPIEAIHMAIQACESLGLTVGSKFYITKFEPIKSTDILTLSEFVDIMSYCFSPDSDTGFDDESDDEKIVH